MEVGNRLIGFDKINDEVTSVKYGVPRVRFYLYLDFDYNKHFFNIL